MARSNPDRYSMIPCIAKIIKLLIAELADRLEADARLDSTNKQPKEYDDSNDLEEWEDVDENSEDDFNRFDGMFMIILILQNMQRIILK
jgi:hypothetical protein